MAKLYIVGTPIGNLKDMTYRAVETLKMVDIIACEDTRHSLPLLNHYDIHAKLVAYHKFNESQQAPKIIEQIIEGKNVAIITDAGMPSISDPGAILVSQCREQGIEMEVVPGPTAIATAFALSGIMCHGFSFLGFLPEKKIDRTKEIEKVKDNGLAIALYVAPHDLTKTANFLYEILGDRRVYVCRELTKIHEEVEVTSLKNFEVEERGEAVMIVEPGIVENPLNDLSIKEHLEYYLNKGMDKKTSIKQVSQDRNIPKNEVYQIALEL